MKIRTGFVSNSSSASFIIHKEKDNYGVHCMLTPEQIQLIHDHEDVCEKYDLHCDSEDAWSVYEEDDCIKASTSMDNFDMEEFLKRINVPSCLIEVEYWG